ncbi:Ribosomal protein S18 acetylase RimI [Hymenobacter daecheongensis DSM 21074]|uniref:Ribosomal protein S18 acetylase RimI n=1 Tax=Hymenobacter daecheongensis DSM 21074 TaxID=1121955 RepID=A0A1M6K1Z4_9BACT|nr:GNAT family N-acetyltransferase [Hymenobacter daecheongensis]SHJ52986.1 Ribosomal protein S18 acetylase RimI [Hymenobacter daecheongensis DSM 21074]
MLHTIIPATAADIPALVALVNSAYRGPESEKGWTTEAHLLGGQRTDAAALRDLLAPENATILLGRDAEGALLGSVYLQRLPAALYLGMLSVAPAWQAHGIGKQLLRAAEDYARRHQLPTMRITVISVRHELLAWYERHGYHRTGAVEPFPTDPRFGLARQPLELLVLEKPLA